MQALDMFRKKYSSSQIIEGLLSGNLAIYTHLDSTFRPRVIKHVCSNYGVEEDGEDLYQDVVFEIYLNAERKIYDETRSHFTTYFMMIVRNRWKDRLRKKQISIKTTELTDANNQIWKDYGNKENSIDAQNSKVHIMRKCIAQLKEEEQEMIRLFYFATMSLESVADTMDISYGYAKQKIHRIREKLRKLVNAQTDLSSDSNLKINSPSTIDEINKYPN